MRTGHGYRAFEQLSNYGKLLSWEQNVPSATNNRATILLTEEDSVRGSCDRKSRYRGGVWAHGSRIEGHGTHAARKDRCTVGK